MSRRKISLNDVGEFIKKRRVELGITQKELGLKIPWPDGRARKDSTIAGWELGYSRVPEALIPPIAKALDLPVETLLRKAGVLQETPSSRLLAILEEAGFSHEDIDNNIELILMIMNKKN